MNRLSETNVFFIVLKQKKNRCNIVGVIDTEDSQEIVFGENEDNVDDESSPEMEPETVTGHVAKMTFFMQVNFNNSVTLTLCFFN